MLRKDLALWTIERNFGNLKLLIPLDEIEEKAELADDVIIFQGIKGDQVDIKALNYLYVNHNEAEKADRINANDIQVFLTQCGFVNTESEQPYYTDRKDLLAFQLSKGAFSNLLDLPIVKTYSHRNGSSNADIIGMGPNDTEQIVEVTENYVSLDDWDGNDLTPQSSLIERQSVSKVISLDGNAVEHLYLLEKWTQQSNLVYAEVLTIDELKHCLETARRDAAGYMYEIGTLSGEVIPDLVGLQEFADILGWTKQRLGMMYARQQRGDNVKRPLPEPIKKVAATPLWTIHQAESYKINLEVRGLLNN